MGEMEVPADALYGASTQRAVLNFPISGQRFPRRVHPRPRPDQAGRRRDERASSSCSTGDVADAIARGRGEVADGGHDDQFPIDIYQTGSGHVDEHEHERGRRPPRDARASAAARRSTRTTTSTSARARTTSIPTALQLSAAMAIEEELLPALDRAAGRARRQGRRALADRQDRADAPPGRDADPARPGVPRLRRPGRGVDPPGAGRPRRAARRCRLAGPRSGPGSTPTPSTRPRACARLSALTGLAVREAAEPLPRPGRARRARSPPTAPSGRSRSSLWKIASRHPADGHGPAGRPGRDRAARDAAGLVDHAGQGEPGDRREPDDGRRPGRRQRHDGRHSPRPARSSS